MEPTGITGITFRPIARPDMFPKGIVNFSLTLIDRYAIHGCLLRHSETSEKIEDAFVSNPFISWKDREGNSQGYQVFHAVTAEAREELTREVIKRYQEWAKGNAILSRMYQEGNDQKDSNIPDETSPSDEEGEAADK